VRPVLRELVDLLALERIDDDRFRGTSQDLGWGTIFGGQVLGQALSAASQTVPEGRSVHSLHAYFLRPGDVREPVVYEVDRIRDGLGFTTRRVVAFQKARPIFNMAASFQIEEVGPDHQDDMPDVPGPDGLPSEEELARRDVDLLPKHLRQRAVALRPIESRPVVHYDLLRPQPCAPTRAVWYRAIDALPDDPAVHRYLLAYTSDFLFLGTALQPHGLTLLDPNLRVASIDHAMWFHRPFRMDDWLLHVVDSPSASGARGLVRGRFFSRDGRLVASTAQEGLVRPLKPLRRA